MVPRDRTCDGGSVFTVAQIVQIVAMTGQAMMTGIIFLGFMKWHVMMGCITS